MKIKADQSKGLPCPGNWKGKACFGWEVIAQWKSPEQYYCNNCCIICL